MLILAIGCGHFWDLRLAMPEGVGVAILPAMVTCVVGEWPARTSDCS